MINSYIEIMRNITAQNADIKAVIFMSEAEISSRISSGMKTPCLILEPLKSVYKASNADNEMEELTAKFWILKEIAQNDFKGEMQAYEECLKIGKDLVNQLFNLLKYQHKNYAWQLDGPCLNNAFGVCFSLKLNLPI